MIALHYFKLIFVFYITSATAWVVSVIVTPLILTFKLFCRSAEANVVFPTSRAYRNMYMYIYYMAELAIWSVRKITQADWLPSRAISYSCRLASFGGKISELI